MLNVDFSISYASIFTVIAIYLIVGYFAMLALNLLEIKNTHWHPVHIERGDRKQRIIKSFWWSLLFSWAWFYSVPMYFCEKHQSKKSLKRYREEVKNELV